MRIRRAELTWLVGGLGMALMAFVVVADRWDAPATLLWVALPLLMIAAAVVLILLRVRMLGSMVEEIRRLTVAIANAQIKTDERVAAIGARLISVSDQQMAMVATLRRMFPAPDDAPTDPGSYGDPDDYGASSGYGDSARYDPLAELRDPDHSRTTTKVSRPFPLSPPASQLRRRGVPEPADSRPDDDATLVYRASDLEDSSSDDEDQHHRARAGPGPQVAFANLKFVATI